MVGRLEGKVERGRVGIEVGWENRVGGACGNDFGGKVCSPSRPLSGILSAWCTRSPCKCTVHEALGAITIPAVSALFIVNTCFRFMSIAYSLPPCISSSIAGTRGGLTRISSSPPFFSSSRRNPSFHKRIFERIERRANGARYPYIREMRSSKFPPRLFSYTGMLPRRGNYSGRSSIAPSIVYRRFKRISGRRNFKSRLKFK